MATARINGIGIQYDMSGWGPPVLFLNDHGARAAHWDRQRRALQLRYRIITFDDRATASGPMLTPSMRMTSTSVMPRKPSTPRR